MSPFAAGSGAAGEAAGVALQRFYRGEVADELDGAIVEGEIELERESGKVRRGGAEEALQGRFVAGAEAVVEGVVLGVDGGLEGSIGFPEPR